MAKLYMMATSNLEKSTEKRYVSFFENYNIRWSHWLPNSWLLATEDDMPIDSIQSSIRAIDIYAEMIIMEVDKRENWGGALFKGDEFRVWIRDVEGMEYK